MIWDLHCHLSGIAGDTPTLRMANLMKFADRMGIERVCVYMGLKFLTDPTAAELRQQNDQALEALQHWHDRAFGFVYVSPNHVEASLKELDRCVKNGPMVGVKLWVARRCRDEQIDPIIQRATALKAVIYQHTWLKTGHDVTSWSNLPGESTPQDLAEMARRHPEASLICGHTGGNWELGVRAIRTSKSVCVDLAGSDPTSGLTEMAVRELGAERVLYGSDVPGRSFASQLAKVQGADIPDAAKRLILGENLRRLLTPILQAKGIRP